MDNNGNYRNENGGNRNNNRRQYINNNYSDNAMYRDGLGAENQGNYNYNNPNVNSIPLNTRQDPNYSASQRSNYQNNANLSSHPHSRNGYTAGSLGERLDNGDYNNTISMPDIYDNGYEEYVENNVSAYNYKNSPQRDSKSQTFDNYSIKNPAFFAEQNNAINTYQNRNADTPQRNVNQRDYSQYQYNKEPSINKINPNNYAGNYDSYYDDRNHYSRNQSVKQQYNDYNNDPYKDEYDIEYYDDDYYDDDYYDDKYYDDKYYDDYYDDVYYDDYYDDNDYKNKKSKNNNSPKKQKVTKNSTNNSQKQPKGKKKPLTKKDGFFACFKKKDMPHIIGVIMCGLQAILSIVLFVVLIILDMLPIGLFILVVVVIAILWGLVFVSQFPRFGKLHIPGKIVSGILIVCLAVGSYYIALGNKAVENVTDETAYEIENFVVAVLAKDSAQTITDAKDYTFGIQSTFEPMNLDKVLEEINTEVGKEIQTKNYNSVLDEINALYSGEVKAVIYNDSFNGTIREQHENLDQEIRIIKTVQLKKMVNIYSGKDVDVTSEPFLFYISGNDQFGELSMIGRSDVNILVAVNPVTREVLLINTPRDYYVELPDISYGMRDKLTHAGIYGMDVQEATLADLYGYEVDYYCRVNFSSLVSIVDCLGGVDVVNDVEFQAIDTQYFPEGLIHLDGGAALMYCRERYAFEDGDYARGRHQQMVIKAIVDKLLSSTGFTSYSKLIKTLENCCATNMPKEAISALVKKQLAEGGTWNIQMAQAEGECMMQECYSMGSTPLSVVMPFRGSISNMSTMLSQVYNGEPVTVLYMGPNDDYSYVATPGVISQPTDETDSTSDVSKTEESSSDETEDTSETEPSSEEPSSENPPSSEEPESSEEISE